jgi:hypothetical protein
MTAPLEYAFISFKMASKEVPLEVPAAYLWNIVPAAAAAKVALDPAASIRLASPYHLGGEPCKFDWLWTETSMNLSVYKSRFSRLAIHSPSCHYCIVRRLAIQTCQLVVNIVATTACKVEVLCKLGARVAFAKVFDRDQYVTSSDLKVQCKHHLIEEGLVTGSCTLTLHWSDGGQAIRSNKLIWKPNIKVPVQHPAGKVKMRGIKRNLLVN